MTEQQPTLPTPERLARALTELGDARLEPIIARAREGFYDTFNSPLEDPQRALADDLRFYGHHTFARRVLSGEFDATMVEADAWANSPAGKSALDSFVERLR